MTARGEQHLLDRIEALEFALAEITTPPPALVEALGMETGVRLSVCESRMLGALMKHRGVAVTRDGLVAAMNYDRPDIDWPERGCVGVLIHHVRRKLRGTPYEGTIRTLRGRGYSYHAPRVELEA